jgi:Uncharacterized protein conserved in bacteria
MTIARSDLGAAVVDGKIYAIGGTNGDSVLGTNEQYDLAANRWTDKASMPTPRFSFATAVYDDKIYCIGGVLTLDYYQDETGFSLSSVTEIYDPDTDNWTTGAPMPQGSDGQASIVNGKIYVISGNSYPSLQITQAYDPTANQWSTKTPMPDRDGHCAASAVIGNKIYVIGGYTITPDQNVVQVYDTATDSWTAVTPPPVYMAGYYAGAVTITIPSSTPKIEIFGLTGSASPYSNGSTANQIYDPTTDTWKTLTSMPTSRQGFGIALLNNEIYTIGGFIMYYPYPDDIGSSPRFFATNERYTLSAVITMPTPTITQAPATNATKTTLPPPTQTPPKLNIPIEDIAIGAAAVFIAIAVSALLLKTRRRKLNEG